MTDEPLQYILGAAEVAGLRAQAERLRDCYGRPDSPEFFEHAWSAVADMPAGLRGFLEEFRRREPSAACLIHGFPVDDEAIGPTPSHWAGAGSVKSTADQEISLALCGLALGDPFAWETLQAGRLIQNILPITGDETRQSGYGSAALLEFHTEDGFHPDRCDYLLLLGLRNHDAVPTIVASVRDVSLPERTRELLSQPRYCILPDYEHIRQLEQKDPDHPALTRMRRMSSDPEPTAVLFGDSLNPYLRIDRPFMHCIADDAEAEKALDELMAELERVQRNVVVGPGTLLVVDNYLAVHGRRPFTARYDGTDRWLKKLTVSRDLRRSVSASHSVHGGRVLA